MYHPRCIEVENEGVWSHPLLGIPIPHLLIDCVQEEIVKTKPGDRYMTLSYVWGNHQNVTSYNFRLSDAPLSIQDAARVVRNLGRRFLWVDRYCIDQTNDASKAMMIQNMAEIYERSEATIVALHGEDDESGLPGVSTVPRMPQPVYESGNGSLISSCPPITALIGNSKWNTRAWTYQEARLSRRCLFFSNLQVYLVCKQCTWSETIPLDPSKSHLAKLLNSKYLDASLFAMSRHGAEHFRDRLEYSKRYLSFENDMLNGFRGVLHRSPFVSLWGVPITIQKSGIDPNVGLALGLLWMKRPTWTHISYFKVGNREKARRRPGFPTWSWASLSAEIYQESGDLNSRYRKYTEGLAVQFPRNEANIQFWLSLDGVGLLRAEEINLDTTKVMSEDEPYLHVEGDFLKLTYAYRGPQHRWYNIRGSWEFFRPDVFDEDQPFPKATEGGDPQGEEDVLILIQWNDKTRFLGRQQLMLMVVEWIDDSHAERRGLLNSYGNFFPTDWIARQPRTRKRFILQ